MKFINYLISPFTYIYVYSFILREKLFGLDIKFNYLPKEISNIFLPVHMDFMWIKRGFIGRNKCLVPKGEPYSARFDESSPYFQTWIGTYFVRGLKKTKFSSDSEKAYFLGNAAIEDQNMWLRTYGYFSPHSYVEKDSIKLIETKNLNNFTQQIYYGEMITAIDDSKYLKKDFKIFHWFSSKVSELYNHVKVDPRFLYKDEKPSTSLKIKLFGYYSIIEVGHNKFIITYVCGALENKDLVNNELLKVVQNLEVVK